MEDAALLSDYAQNRSEGAFRELVRRHIDLVYSAALRQAYGDSHRAKDITQSVFLALAQQAPAVAERPVLISWLYKTTRYTATVLLRAERRRKAREEASQFMQQIDGSPNAAGEWDKIRPVVDDAVGTLNEKDQEAVLLRFFNGASLATIGQMLGVSEDAAQKRVDRALERLRQALAKRGITSTAAFLAAALAQQGVAAAPAGLALAVGNSVFAGGATLGATLWTLTHLMTMSKASLGIISALVVAGSASFVWQQHQNSQLHQELADLRGQTGDHEKLVAANEKIAQLESAHTDTRGQLVKSQAELADLQRQADARAKHQAEEAKNDPDGKAPLLSPMVPISKGKMEGNATATSAFRSIAVALSQGEIDQMTQMIGFSDRGRKEVDELFAKLPDDVKSKYGSPEKIFAMVMASRLPELESAGVVSDTPQSDNTEVLRMRMQTTTGHEIDDSFTFRQSPTGWLVQIPDRSVEVALQRLSASTANVTHE